MDLWFNWRHAKSSSSQTVTPKSNSTSIKTPWELVKNGNSLAHAPDLLYQKLSAWPSNLYDASICLIITGLENWKDTHRERGGHRKSTELEMKLQSSLAGQNKKNLSIFLNYCHLATSTCIWHCLWAGHCTTCWSIILNQMIFTYKYFLRYVQNSKICSVSIHNFQL